VSTPHPSDPSRDHEDKQADHGDQDDDPDDAVGSAREITDG
jgi:hypothetical protein